MIEMYFNGVSIRYVAMNYSNKNTYIYLRQELYYHKFKYKI